MEYLLLYKKLHNLLTSEEEKIFDQWYSASRKHREHYHKMEKMSKTLNRKPTPVNREAAWERLIRKLEF